MDIKFWFFKNREKYSFGLEVSSSVRLWGMEVWLLIQIAWKFHLKPIKPLENSNLSASMEFYSFREDPEFISTVLYGYKME